jgi:hypothetical protein
MLHARFIAGLRPPGLACCTCSFCGFLRHESVRTSSQLVKGKTHEQQKCSIIIRAQISCVPAPCSSSWEWSRPVSPSDWHAHVKPNDSLMISLVPLVNQGCQYAGVNTYVAWSHLIRSTIMNCKRIAVSPWWSALAHVEDEINLRVSFH